MKAFERDIAANDKNWLYIEYCKNKKSIREMAESCNVSSDTIKTRLKRYNIPIRGRDSANKLSASKKPKTYKKTDATRLKQESQKTGETISCNNCGKKNYRPACRINKNNFCSIKCRDIFLRKNINRSQNWRDYPEYEEWRKSVYKRDIWKCVLCGSKNKINAHHIFEGQNHPESRFQLENGITLCQKHHIMLHKKPRSFIKELIKKISNIGEHLEADNPEASIRTILYALTTTKREPERFMV